ncbi:hypothetical protein MmTuc01_2380 [Methanosarcina mazei Tuc01]|uniref:Uncharacterized protein n=1 Tax=Methanosarcina mazei Tuc01 TaxID=1236903 RepID=M1Q5Q8_METMZ|nr:hypothetical protein MmTuc01_2380 [Methanosarcina mazei Tuc01]
MAGFSAFKDCMRRLKDFSILNRFQHPSMIILYILRQIGG